MTPRMQTELIRVIFKTFLQKFNYFFQGLEQGFINELLINLSCKQFEAGENIIRSGDRFTELMFII